MATDDEAPSWSQQSGRAAQRSFVHANARGRRLRREQTSTEKRLWTALRRLNREEGFHFRRQPAVGPWVYDFGDFSRRLVIEVDGGVHEAFAEVADRDEKKTRWAAINGFRLLRLANLQVWGDLDAAVSAIRRALSR
jgi:very-short-patch-repair endonuclease